MGRDSVENETRSGRPTTSKTDKNVERVKSRSDRRLTIRLIAEKLNLNKSTVHHLLTNDLEMRKIFTKLVQNLTVQQKYNKKDLCTGVIERIEHDPDFVKKVITGGY